MLRRSIAAFTLPAMTRFRAEDCCAGKDGREIKPVWSNMRMGGCRTKGVRRASPTPCDEASVLLLSTKFHGPDEPRHPTQFLSTLTAQARAEVKCPNEHATGVGRDPSFPTLGCLTHKILVSQGAPSKLVSLAVANTSNMPISPRLPKSLRTVGHNA